MHIEIIRLRDCRLSGPTATARMLQHPGPPSGSGTSRAAGGAAMAGTPATAGRLPLSWPCRTRSGRLRCVSV